MTVYVKNIIPCKTVEVSQVTQYTAEKVTTIIDKFTATNYSDASATISINIVTVNNVVGDTNVITKSKTLQPSEVYTFPEIVGQVLNPGDFISTLTDSVNAINIRASGREVTI